MLCQLCKMRIANVQLTQVVNNQKAVMFICDQCAKEKGQLGFGPAFNIGTLLSSFFGTAQSSQAGAEDRGAVCPECGFTFDDISRIGKLGCKSCYSTHAQRLLPIIKRIHGSSKHKGKYPHKLSSGIAATRELDSLKAQLAQAIKEEKYEKAAEIRDRIKMLDDGGTQNAR